MHRFFAFGALGAAPLASFAFAFGFLACSSSTPPGNVDAGDGGADATLDAPQGNDAVADTTLEASSEASADGGSEASNPPPFGDAAMDAWPDAPPGPSNPCQLPGSIQFTTTGKVTVPGGGASWPDLSFLTLQTGFCAHHFATVPNARQIRFAPGGELFVASPTTGTTGGGQGGKAAIVVLPDDNLDGVADTTTTFLGSLPSTQGLLFANGYFYYQDGTKIMRLAYAAGERVASGTPEQVADITVYTSSLHWPKTLDIADDGTIYVGNGGDQGETCDPAHPFHGGILSLGSGSTTSATQVAKGLRNPITVRCARGHNRCFALELAKDYSSGDGGGREKLLPIHAGDDWGFPCCATTNLPYVGTPAGTDCSGVTPESNGFLIGETPFGLDFEQGHWTGEWNGRAFVATHGVVGSWTGARIVGIPMDPMTGLTLPSSDTDGGNTGMSDFATGWDDGTNTHGRPASVLFAPDGRMFVANDNNGEIFWIASL